MTSLEIRISPCGDYVPGTEPRQPTQNSNTLPPTYTPQGNSEVPTFPIPGCPPPPVEPPPITPTIPRLPQPPGVPGGGPTTGGPAGPTTGGPAGPTTGGPAGGGGGPTTGGPAGPTTGGPAGTGPGTPGPTTGGGVTKYRCTSTPIYCQQDKNIQPPEARRIAAIARNCTLCNPDEIEAQPGCIHNSQAECLASPCRSQNSSNNCLSEPIGEPNQEPTGGSVVTTSIGSVELQANEVITNQPQSSVSFQYAQRQVLGPQQSLFNQPLTIAQRTASINAANEAYFRRVNSLRLRQAQQIQEITTSPTSTTNAAQQSSLIQQASQVRQPLEVNVADPVYQGYASSSTDSETCPGIYHPYYNFFNTTVTQETSFVANDLYLSVFSNEVAKEVSYFLQRENTTASWDEKNITNLTIEKISSSLKPNLLQAINNLNGVGNTKIDSAQFYKAIKSHLVRGTMGEFDANFFISLYEKQLADPLYTYNQTGQNNNTINLAFAIFEQLSKNPNYESSENSIEQNDDFKRMRFLAEDLETYVSVLQDDGELYELYTNNLGIPTEQSVELLVNPASGVALNFGDGAGYYFSSMFSTSAQYPLMTFNSLSGAYYLEPRDRYNILKVLNVDPAITLTVSSLQNVHEFTATYNPSADLAPVYFKLDLVSVGDIVNVNSVITTTSAIYTRLTDEEAVAHSRNNGFNVIKTNIDFRDPFIQYAGNSSSINFRFNEFNLRSFGKNRTLNTDKIMLRNLPQAIILSPGCGSFHNPFNGQSVYQDYSNSTVSRVIKIEPSIYTSNLEVDKPALEQTRLYSELSSNYFGLYEQYFNNDYHGFIYNYNPSGSAFEKSYYLSGEYTSVQPASSLRVQSPEANLINLANKLTSALNEYFSENPENAELFGFLTWYDIYTRLKINDIGGMMFSNIRPLLDKLSNGFSNGYQVKLVLDELNAFGTGIPDVEGIIPNDNIIINIGDRLNFYYGNT